MEDSKLPPVERSTRFIHYRLIHNDLGIEALSTPTITLLLLLLLLILLLLLLNDIEKNFKICLMLPISQ